MIGLTNDQIMILTNHVWCYKASSAPLPRGLKILTLEYKSCSKSSFRLTHFSSLCNGMKWNKMSNLRYNSIGFSPLTQLNFRLTYSGNPCNILPISMLVFRASNSKGLILVWIFFKKNLVLSQSRISFVLYTWRGSSFGLDTSALVFSPRGSRFDSQRGQIRDFHLALVYLGDVYIPVRDKIWWQRWTLEFLKAQSSSMVEDRCSVVKIGL